MLRTLLASLLFGCLAAAAPAVAQQKGMFHVDGWKWRNNEQTGTLYFHCVDRSLCSEGAMVSYRAAGSSAMTLDQFRSLQDQNAKKLLAQLPDSDPKLIEIRSDRSDAVPAFIAIRSVVLDRQTAFSVNAYFDGPQNDVSMISSAPTRQEAERNFKKFVSLAITVAKGRSN